MGAAEEERARRIDELVERVHKIEEPEHRDCALSLMDAILELHGAGIERMIDIVVEAGEAGEGTVRRFTTDPLVSSLLLLHNLHPDDPETRVREALRKVHGRAELTGIFEGAATVRLADEGCGLADSVEALIRDAAPEVTQVTFIGSSRLNGFVPVAALAPAVPKVI